MGTNGEWAIPNSIVELATVDGRGINVEKHGDRTWTIKCFIGLSAPRFRRIKVIARGCLLYQLLAYRTKRCHRHFTTGSPKEASSWFYWADAGASIYIWQPVYRCLTPSTSTWPSMIMLVKTTERPAHAGILSLVAVLYYTNSYSAFGKYLEETAILIRLGEISIRQTEWETVLLTRTRVVLGCGVCGVVHTWCQHILCSHGLTATCWEYPIPEVFIFDDAQLWMSHSMGLRQYLTSPVLLWKASASPLP